MLAAREGGVVETLRGVLGDTDVSRAVTLLRHAVDPLAQLWHGCTLLREYRR